MNSSKLLGPAEAYIDLLDKHLVAQIVASRAEAKMPLRPSSAGDCTRALGYALNEYRGKAQYPYEEPSPDLHRLFQLGHTIEADLLKMFERVPDFELKYRQQVVSFFQLPITGEWLEGSIDFVIWSPEFKAVGDVKSKKQKFSSYNSSDWQDWSERLGNMVSVNQVNDRLFWVNDLEPFLAELNDVWFAMNFLQLNMYANSQFIKERGIDHCVIIQYGKNTSELREVRFKPSEKIYEQIKQKLLNVSTVIDSQGSPDQLPRDHSLGSFKCKTCRFATDCWPGKDATKEYFNTWPAKEWPKDSYRLAEGSTLEELFVEMQEAVNQGTKAKMLEQSIVRILEQEKVKKVKLNNGQVWELKLLQTGLVVRRGKL